MVIDLFIPHDPALRCIALILALMLDPWLGEPQWLCPNLPHPPVPFGRAIGVLDRHLNRPDRTGRTRRMRGVVPTTSEEPPGGKRR